MAKPKLPTVLVQAFADHHIITQPNRLRNAVRYIEGKEVSKELDDPVARAEQALAGLSGEFDGWMTIECNRLAAAHAAILKDGFSRSARDELFRAAHDIKGDAATFGYAAAGAAAESLCRIIEHAPDMMLVPDDLIAHHIQAIQAIVREQTDIDRIGVASTLSASLRSVADEYLTAVNHDRPDHLEAILAPSIVPEE